MKRYGIIMLLLFAVLCSFAACGNTATEEERPENTAGPDKVDEYINETFFEELKYVYLAEDYDTGLWVYGSTDANADEFKIFDCDLTTGKTSIVNYPVSPKQPILSLCPGSGEDLWVMEYLEVNGSDSYCINVLSGGAVSEFEHEKITDSFPIRFIVDIEKDRLYIHANDFQNSEFECLYIYSLDGTCVSKIHFNTSVQNILLSNGKLYSIQNSNHTSTLKVLNEATWSFEDIYSFENVLDCSLAKGTTEDMITVLSGTDLMQFDLEKRNVSRHQNLTAGGIAGNVRFVFPYNNDYYIVTRDITGFDRIIRTSFGDANSTTQILLTLAALQADPKINLTVADYNSRYPDCRIEVKDYSVFGDEALRQLNLDIMSGGAIDLIYLDGLQVENYINAGILENLVPYIETMDKNIELLEPVMSALCEGPGESYIAAPFFVLNAICGREEVLSEFKGEGLEGFLSFLEANSRNGVNAAGNGLTPEEFLEYVFTCNMSSFVDFKASKAKFASPEFIKLLETIKAMNSKDENYNEFVRIYEGVQPISFQSVRSLNDLVLLLSVYPEELSLISPSLNDTQSFSALLVPIFPFAIASSSENKELAWRFLEYMYGEEYQTNFTSPLYFPTNSKVLESSWLKLKEYYGSDDADDGFTYLYVEDGRYSELSIKYPENVLDCYEILHEMIKNIDGVYKADYTLLNVINYNISAFLSDEKSAEETAQIINGKAEIYLSEIS